MRALDDLRVLDLSGQVAGPFCARLLGDFGADVIKVEPPGGEDGRRLPPLDVDRLGPEASAFFLYLNANKRGITLDITTPTGADIFRRLVRETDVVVESFPPGLMDSLGLGFDALEALRPGIIVTSITPFGQTGPWRDLPANELITYACSGWASVTGRPDREPLKGSGYNASFQAGVAAFNATLNAVIYRDRAGVGQHADVSILEPSVASFAPGILGAQYRGEPGRRQKGNFQRGPVATADGHFSLTLSRAHFWRDAMNELGLPQFAEDPKYFQGRQEIAEEIAPEVEGRIAQRGKRELFEALGRLRVVGGMVLTTAELFEDPHVRAREFFVTMAHPTAGTLAYPGAPFKMSATPWEMCRPAPLLSQHTAEVLAGVGITTGDLVILKSAGVI
jgi:formyl-CoA transferase/CoA:oxalate CoA-transferase